jgi:hypothetical protein
MRRWVGAAVVFVAAVVAGCADNGPKRFRLSGEVKYDGKPIPYGEVLFTPDGAKKNSGPQGIAQIRDGKYDTALEGGKGVGAGPMVVRVTGFDRQGGKLLCEVELPADLPAADAKHDIDVPKQAAPPDQPAVKRKEI